MRFFSALFTCVFAWIIFGPHDSTRVSAGTAVRMELEDLVECAELIVEGRILSQRSVEANGRIETEYLVQVERTFQGSDIEYRTIRVPGGVLDDGRGLMLAGMPHIAAGDRSLLFLSRETNGVRMPIGLAQGKFEVRSDDAGMKRLVRGSVGVSLVDVPSGVVTSGNGLVVREYAEVVARIEAALVAKRSGR